MKKILSVTIIFISSIAFMSCTQHEVPESCDVYSIDDEEEVIGYIEGYAIVRVIGIRCECILGEIVVDGYDFGFFSDGCENDLDWIGYSAEKDGISYSIQTLVDEHEISTAQVYHLYMCDPNHLGNTS